MTRSRRLTLALIGCSSLFICACESADGDLEGARDRDAAPLSDASLDADDGAGVDAVHPARIGVVDANFTLRPGVETVTVTDAGPGASLTLYDAGGARLVTITADALGQAHFAYLPATYMRLDLDEISSAEVVKDGTTLTPGGGYVIRDDTVDPPAASEVFTVLGVHDVGDPALYEAQVLRGVHYGVLGLSEGEEPDDGFNYITMRDGARLGAMVRFPDPALWGEGPWPTVMEYSGYSPSNPRGADPGTEIATLLGFATVAVNMRGTGCSGGVFDVFNPAQHADGYDLIEVIARQDWVKGHRVGMVGLSYSGISQLFVARTNPPSLAAITPQSVIADSWAELWPGGIYNDGFTRQWLEERDREAAPNGQHWTDARIAMGDTICEEHQRIHALNIAFERFFKRLEFYPPTAADRSLPLLVSEIEAPVYLTGAFQDEQTGAQFAEMLDQFTSAEVTRFTLYNGRHVDGYSPLVLTRWWEFLELYVAREVPRMPAWLRDIAGPELSKAYGVTGLGFEPDRFADLDEGDYELARARYEAEPPVRVLFENGAGVPDQPGAPIQRFEIARDAWPPPDASARVFFLGSGAALSEAAPTVSGEDTYLFDPDAGGETFFGPRGYELMVPLWDIDWTRFPAGRAASYLTAPFSEDLVVAGPSYAELWLASEVSEVNVQVTISEVRSDGVESLVQSGWLRVGHGAETLAGPTQTEVIYDYLEGDFTPLTPGELRRIRVPIPSVAQVFRAGSRLRLKISTPGRDHGTWEFANPSHEGAPPEQRIAWGPGTPSALHLPVISGVEVPEGYPPCPSLRGQPCRPWSEPAPGER